MFALGLNHQPAPLDLRGRFAFPAEQLTPGWIAAQRAPFPTAEFVATGGIGLANADDFLTAGARVLAIGSALTDGDQLEQLGRLVAR